MFFYFLFILKCCVVVFVQVHFLWFHIKDVIKSFETFERYVNYV